MKTSGKFNNNAKIINKTIKQERPQDKFLRISGKKYKGRSNNSRNTHTSWLLVKQLQDQLAKPSKRPIKPNIFKRVKCGTR
jgi:hypothetical protein